MQVFSSFLATIVDDVHNVMGDMEDLFINVKYHRWKI